MKKLNNIEMKLMNVITQHMAKEKMPMESLEKITSNIREVFNKDAILKK